MTKWIMGVAIVLVIGAGAWWYFTHTQAPTAEQASTAQNNGTAAASDTSDQALTQDAANIDAQLQAYDAEAAQAQ